MHLRRRRRPASDSSAVDDLDVSELQAYYEKRLLQDVLAGDLGKKALVWQEVFLHAGNDPVGTLGADTVVDVWNGDWAATVPAGGRAAA